MPRPKQIRMIDMPREKPLTLSEIRALYDVVDWGILKLHKRFKKIYPSGKFDALPMFKAYGLCFLSSIPNDVRLVAALQEYPSLRALCGFDESPERINVYSFRVRRKESPFIFADLMRRFLIALRLATLRLPSEIDLPFVRFRSAPDDNFHVSEEFDLADTGYHVQIWKSREVSNGSKQGLEAGLGLPARVIVNHQGTNYHDEFILDLPLWIKSERSLRGLDAVTGVPGVSSGTNYYVACNLLVLRQDSEGNNEVLLAKRANGSGVGKYTLPGGKKVDGESVLQCAERELFQEVGLKLRSGSICSLWFNIEPNKSVISIGVLVEDYSGKPRRREKMQHEEWDWYMMDFLPEPMFHPSETIFEHYASGLFQSLTWRDIERIAADFEDAVYRLGGQKVLEKDKPIKFDQEQEEIMDEHY